MEEVRLVDSFWISGFLYRNIPDFELCAVEQTIICRCSVWSHNGESFVWSHFCLSFLTIYHALCLQALFCLWFLLSVPLCFIGSYFGFKSERIEHPLRTNPIPRQIPTQVSHNTSLEHSMLNSCHEKIAFVKKSSLSCSLLT